MDILVQNNYKLRSGLPLPRSTQPHTYKEMPAQRDNLKI